MITKKSQESLDYIASLTGSKLTLGNLLLSIRQCEEMSQVDFAKQLGVSRQNLCDIEHNFKNLPDLLIGSPNNVSLV